MPLHKIQLNHVTPQQVMINTHLIELSDNNVDEDIAGKMNHLLILIKI